MVSTRKNNRHPLIRIFEYVLRHKAALVLSLVFSTVFAFFTAVSIASLIPVLKVIIRDDPRQEIIGLTKDMPFLKETARSFLNWILFTEDKMTLLWVTLGVFVALNVLKGIARLISEYSCGVVTNYSMMELANKLYEHMLKLDLAFYHKTGVAEAVSRFTNDMEFLYRGVKMFSGKIFREPMKAIFILLLCIWLNWKLTLIALVVLPPIALAIYRTGRYVRKKGRRMLISKANLVSILQESLFGIRIVRIFLGERFESGRYRRENLNVAVQNMKVIKAEGVATPLLEILGIIGISIVVLVAGNDLISETLKFEDFIIFFLALGQLIDPVRKMGDVNARYQTMRVAGERVFEFLDAEPTIVERPGAEDIPLLADAVEYQDVSFEYIEGRPVLDKVSFTAKYNQVTAFVGPSGAGKTTLVNLLPRFFDPTDGKITIDGHDIAEATFTSLRGQVAMVTQETILFDDTIAANIAYAIGDADMDKVVAAAKAANAHDFIEKMPMGYDTVIGESGVTLSGGQKQRLAIARAIYKDPAVLILDEATSSLDSESESLIQDALKKFMVGRLTYVIAHRLSTVENADKIIVLNEGRIEATGRHAELLESSETYRTLYYGRFAKDGDSAKNE